LIRRLIFAAVLVSAVVAFGPRALEAPGTWLVVQDPLQRARAAVVFGGAVPFRAMEAAALYQQGWAREVWLSPGRISDEDTALARLGIKSTSDADYNRQVLQRLKVPANAIRVIDGPVTNTADEVRLIARALEAAGADRAILVTSKYHTRRVRMLWRTLIGTRPEALVRAAAEDPFEPDRWWRISDDAMAVSREWFGLLNARMGFPVKSRRE
jgi:uncharacterized SAM-binding protein YcdF (DUF218 family)